MKNGNAKLKIFLYILLKYIIKSKFIKLFFFFEWQDFCMDFNQNIRFGRGFIVSVSDNEPSRYVRKCPLLANIVHAGALWRHFFNHSR